MSANDRSSGPGWMDAALLMAVLIWGTNFSIVKFALAEMTPMSYNALRFGGASVLTLLFARIVERNIRIDRRDWGYFLLLSLIGNLLYEILYINGLALSRAGDSSLILSTAPIWVAILGTLTRQEHLRPVNWAGITLSFAGLYILLSSSGKGLIEQRGTTLGGLLVLASAMCWAFYTLLLRRMVQRYSTLVTTAWVMTITTPVLVLAAVPDLLKQNWQAISSRSWLGLAYSTVMAIAVGYTIWSTGVKRVGSARTAVYSYLTPLVSVTFAWITLGEVMRPLQGLGAGAILLGVVLGRYRPAR